MDYRKSECRYLTVFISDTETGQGGEAQGDQFSVVLHTNKYSEIIKKSSYEKM